MSRHAAAITGRSWLMAAALGLVTVVLLAVTVGQTYAFFTDEASVSAGPSDSSGTAFTSGSIATPTISRAEQRSSGAVITWTAPSVGAGGARADGYEVYRYASASAGTATLACAKTTALTCTDTATDTTGTVYYELRAYFYNWKKSSTRVAYSPDRAGPTLGLTQPSSTNQAASNLRTQVSRCSPSGIACGTASDDADVSLVEYTLRRQVSGTSRYDCWSGSAWQTSPDDSCDIYKTANGTTTWTVPGNPSTAYPNNSASSFLLMVRATDTYGNVRTGSVSYTVRN